MRKCIIFLNGKYDYKNEILNELFDENTDYYCADGGANFIFEYGKIPKIIVGDLDSIKSEVLNFFKEKNVEIKKYPPEKDFTDFELILKEVEKNKKYDKIYVLGGLGGRIDMTLNNLHLLEEYKNLIFLSQNDDKIEEIFYAEKNLTIENKKNWEFSIIPLDNLIKNLSLKGFKYEVSKIDVYRKNSRLVSNIITENKCEIKFEIGKILVYLTKKIS